MWEIESAERIDRLFGRIDDVDQSFVGADLELLTGILVLEGCAENGVDLLFGWERDWTLHASSGFICHFQDLLDGFVENDVVVGQ